MGYKINNLKTEFIALASDALFPIAIENKKTKRQINKGWEQLK